MAWHGMAWLGAARRGMGMAWRGVARRGVAWHESRGASHAERVVYLLNASPTHCPNLVEQVIKNHFASEYIYHKVHALRTSDWPDWAGWIGLCLHADWAMQPLISAFPGRCGASPHAPSQRACSPHILIHSLAQSLNLCPPVLQYKDEKTCGVIEARQGAAGTVTAHHGQLPPNPGSSPAAMSSAACRRSTPCCLSTPCCRSTPITLLLTAACRLTLLVAGGPRWRRDQGGRACGSGGRHRPHNREPLVL